MPAHSHQIGEWILIHLIDGCSSEHFSDTGWYIALVDYDGEHFADVEGPYPDYETALRMRDMW